MEESQKNKKFSLEIKEVKEKKKCLPYNGLT